MTVWERLRGSSAGEGLERQMRRGDAAHAWLLLGPPGSGKRRAAEVMAAALNCPVAPNAGCGECSSCVRILRHRHPDVHYIVPEGPLIPVDVVRELVIPEASRSPFESAYKVFIIEEADRMNEPAQNALLKTLEEPWRDTVFILVSDLEDDLLETVRSRCRIVRLEPVSEARIAALLEDEGVSEEHARLAARLSDGDLGRARVIAREDSAAERRAFWTSIPRRLVAPVDALDAAAEILAIARAEVKARETAQKSEVVELAEALGEGRGTAAARTALAKRHKRELRRVEEEILGEALQSLASFYRDILVVRSGSPDAVINLDLVAELETWARADGISDRALVEAVQRCVTTRSSLARNANQTLAIEATLVDVTRLVAVDARVGTDW